MPITDAFNHKYTGIWGEALQQKTSRLKEYVTVDTNAKGESVSYSSIDTVEFEEKTARFQTTNLDEVDCTRRIVYPRYFSKAIGFDEFDSTQLNELQLPLTNAIKELGRAAERRMDRVMLDGFLGTNKTGMKGEISVDFDSNQTIDASATNLTVEKLRQALQKFQENEAWNDDSLASGDKLCLAVSSSQLMALLREKEITSADYNNVKALVNGEVNSFLGFTVVRTEQLPLVGNIRTNLAWVKSKTKFAVWSDYKVKTSVRDDLDEAIQVRARFACGATRMDEKAFVKILCDQSK